MRKAITISLLLFAVLSLRAQEIRDTGIYPYVTHTSTGWFGPNAFPVPDMPDGTTSDKLRIELAGDCFLGERNAPAGSIGGWTCDVFAKVVVPLFTPRVNLTVWMPVMEWYDSGVCHGHVAGDVSVSTEIHILKERKWAPDILVRAAWKSASGGEYDRSRYFDCPGYFFDLTLGKSVRFEGCWLESLRFAANAGFLCWQTNISRQNDAVMYGLKAVATGEWLGLSAEWTGYVGWQDDRDRPMNVKARLYGRVKGFEPFIQYGCGLVDYPFHQIRLGLVYTLPLFEQ